MEPEIEKKLESLAKNKTASAELKEIFTDLENSKRSLSLLEKAIENDYDSIMITDVSLDEPGPKIVYVNEGFTKITGYERDEAIGKTPRILQGPKTDQAVLNRLKKRLKEGRAFFGKAVNYRKDGSEFVNQWDIHPMTDETGNLTHWVSYQHDITERKRAEGVVIDTKIEFDELRRHASSTFIDADREGTIQSSNKSFRKLTGYQKDELEGKKIWEFFPKKYRDSLKGRFDEFEEEEFDQMTFRGIIHHKEGFPIQVEGITKVLKLQEGDLIRADIKNVSLQKRVMKNLQKQNKNYRAVVNKASEFTYSVSFKNDTPEPESISDHFEAVTGVSKDDVLQPNGLGMYIHKDDLDKVHACLRQVREDESGTCEYRIKQKGGGYQLALDSAQLNNSGKIKGAVSLVNKAKFEADLG